MEFRLFRKIKISTSLIMLCIIVCPLSKTFSEDKIIFSDGDLDTYQYGNGKTESAVIKNADKTPEKIGTTHEVSKQDEEIDKGILDSTLYHLRTAP